MANLGTGIQQLILLVLLATFVHLLLPSSGLERYARLVLGLTMVWAILHWLLGLIGQRSAMVFPDFPWPVKRGESEVTSIQRQGDYLRQLREKTAHHQAEQALAIALTRYVESQFSVRVVKASVVLESRGQQVTQARVVLTRLQGGRDDSISGGREQRFIRPVEIGVDRLGEKEGGVHHVEGGIAGDLCRSVQRAVAQWLGISPDRVEVVQEGRGLG
ncbi:stage III sporulation protein AF [Pasteuria penetrans]|uniref:stage III sporulation protein AF n=1 Tax=Pasteuria penetrans TaxID=86005 RepID=UPI000F99F956|nr:stage III sporulation protein AF [Pasteuria penetrans]